MSSISRRSFIQLSAVSSLGLVIGIPRFSNAAAASHLHPLIRVGTDGTITLFAQNPEMGQGVKTALPMIIAEELDVDWHECNVEQADWNSEFENQFSGGSLSIRLNYDAMRQAGASARHMLLSAAAERLGVAADMLDTRNGEVVNGSAILSYAELAEAAASMPVPEEPQLKNADEFRIVGTSLPDVDLERMTTGQQLFTSDLTMPGMLHAVVKRCPVGDGQPESYDDSEARKVKGVVDFHVLRNMDHGGRIILPNCPNFVSGVAVLATNTWAALEGARKLDVKWQLPETLDDSAELMQRFEQALDEEAQVIRNDGEIGRKNDIDATYRLPFLAHVPMEPMTCAAQVQGDRIEVWLPTQNPSLAAEAIAKALEIDQSQIAIHVMRSGGAFGRRFYGDFAIDTVLLARQFGRPVKVIWPREDDVRHDYFRPANVQRLRASTDDDGNISHWHHKVVSHPRDIYLERDGNFAELGNYEFPAGFIPNLLYEYKDVPARIPVGQWRAVSHSGNVFVVSSAIDELAHKDGIDPLEFWLNLVGDEFVQVREDFNFDASRLRTVIETAAEKSDWGIPLPKGKGRGIAASYNQGGWVAEVAEVTVESERLSVDRIVCAVDCGLVINPQGAVNQIEGGIIEGLSAALFGDITVTEGVVDQSNFNDYPVCRIIDSPEIDVHLIERTDAPRGLGEPPLPPLAPAVCNAVFAATGQRIRELPLRKHFRI